MPHENRTHPDRPAWWPDVTRHPHRPHRPPWWPENEAWPPKRGHLRHNPFFRRLGCLFIFFNLLCLAIFAAVIVFVVNALGLVHLSVAASPWLLPLGALVVVFIVAVAGVGGFGLRRIFMPLDDLLDAAGRVAEGDYSIQVSETGPREVRALSKAFNNMAARLHLADEQRRNLLADVTHELRTPLTVIQGNLEGMLDGVYPPDEANLRSLLEETTVLSRLVEDLRTLALAESGALKLRKEPTDLLLLIHDTVAAFQATAESGGVDLTVETGDDSSSGRERDEAGLEIDPARIRQVLSNLVANALRYTPPGGRVCVQCRMSGTGAILEVQDSGPGISADDLPHVFERFYKSGDSGGMGLGLAIAKHLVSAHGGTIEAESPAEGGTLMRVSLQGSGKEDE